MVSIADAEIAPFWGESPNLRNLGANGLSFIDSFLSDPGMQVEELRDLVINTLEDMKASDIVTLDVRGKTSITDYFVIATGTSDRHVKSTAESVAFQAKQAGQPPIGTEGLNEGEWALIDLNGVVVHVMQAKVRDFYQLERLWNVDPAEAEKLSRERGAS
jgi:ribosome-associated protein